MKDTSGNNHQISFPYVFDTNNFQYVAVTYDKSSGAAVLYLNGTNVASANFGSITPQTTYPVNIGRRTGQPNGNGDTYGGLLDEFSLYNRALSSNEIALIYAAGGGGKLFISKTPPPLDTDQDGIPDYWETTLGEYPTNFSANADRDGDGYTDLEEYMNWLAAPHALTVTNTPVSVDLLALCGKTGNLSFAVTNGVNGFVYLTNVLGSVTNTGTFSNSIAVFTPTNSASGGTNFYGYASFGFFVTNNDTVAYFGPVAVSVMVSAVPVTYGSVTGLTNNAPTMNSVVNSPTTNSVVIASNSIAYFSIFAPANADFATNILNFASAPLNLWFNQTNLPSGSNPGDFELLTNSTGGSAVLTTNSVPSPSVPSFTPGQIYYLALQNTNNFAVTNYAITVNFHLLPAGQSNVVTGPVNPPVFRSAVVARGGVQLQWSAFSGGQVEVQWTTNLTSPGSWNTITNPATITVNGVTTFTDDGEQTAPLGAQRFYRLVQMPQSP
jgi:hypothetical protein